MSCLTYILWICLLFGIGRVRTNGTIENLNCYNDYLEEIVCTWETSVESNCSAQYTVSYGSCSPSTIYIPTNLEGRKTLPRHCICRGTVSVFAVSLKCDVEIHANGRVVLNDTVRLGDTVKPRPPGNLNIQKNESRDLILSWTTEYPSDHFFHDRLLFQVHLQDRETLTKISKIYNVTAGIHHVLFKEQLPSGHYIARVRAKPFYKGQWSEWSSEYEWYSEHTPAKQEIPAVAIAIYCISLAALIILCYVSFKKLKRKYWEIIPDPSKSQLAGKNFRGQASNLLWDDKLCSCSQKESCIQVLQEISQRGSNQRNSLESRFLQNAEKENRHEDTAAPNNLLLSVCESCCLKQHFYPDMIFSSWMMEEPSLKSGGSTVICNHTYELLKKVCALDQGMSDNFCSNDHQSTMFFDKIEPGVLKAVSPTDYGYKGFERCVAEGLSVTGADENKHSFAVPVEDQFCNPFSLMLAPSSSEQILNTGSQQIMDLASSGFNDQALSRMFTDFTEGSNQENMTTLHYLSQFANKQPYPSCSSIDLHQPEAFFKYPAMFGAFGNEMFSNTAFNFYHFKDKGMELQTLPFQSFISQSSPHGLLCGTLNSSKNVELNNNHLLGLPDTTAAQTTGYESYDSCVNKTEISVAEDTHH